MTPARGRPRRTTPAEVTRAALELFAERGFEETTVDEIAAAVGLHRRSLFRYFDSKNDIVWGDFDWVLERLRGLLDEADPELPLIDAIGRAVVASNSYPPDAQPELRIRMTMITTVPSLQAHSMLRYAAWRRVIADYAARRLGTHHRDLVPLTLGHAALGASMAAFSAWVEDPDSDLDELLKRAYALLADGFRT
ncbi:mycofactocin system transcriptional regulator [Conexibacter sp. CPCC 206217]|uniref:mycofactocin system transcriptional regulator n=1 Tax=Conexibacter sp. CPCC 206217 TaxID=3064574 RepID=UPI0027241AB6|nr:mycofactocin system transcriptional regulator [Conexibacter sp. CPCC 206217]MDO8210272.1 mycofactocin system transcriptional regulator [Conexibacter sp. CPCC 206217]